MCLREQDRREGSRVAQLGLLGRHPGAQCSQSARTDVSLAGTRLPECCTTHHPEALGHFVSPSSNSAPGGLPLQHGTDLPLWPAVGPLVPQVPTDRHTTELQMPGLLWQLER